MLPHLQPSRPTNAPQSRSTVSPPLVHIRDNYNPAVRHPAFFTERLQRVGAGAATMGGSSPITVGYVYVLKGPDAKL